ncbi:MAG: hypothetical protein PVI38_21770 [Desulfobacterales bacterium]|jgi:hypothetical protein
MTITGISQNFYHIQGTFHQGRIADLSEPQKEVWQQFVSENGAAADLEDKERTPEPTSFSLRSSENLFSFNPCGCKSLAGIADAKAVENLSAEGELRYGLNSELIADPSAMHDSDGQNAELIADPTGKLISQNAELIAESALMPDNAGAADEETPKIRLDGSTATENILETSVANIVDYVSDLLSEGSPMTYEWLSDHFGVAKLISTFPEFASHLNENSDLALNFMQSLEEVKSILADFFNQNAVEKASELLSDDSIITDEWLDQNINAAQLIATNPAFAVYLQDNIEQAEKFISLSA